MAARKGSLHRNKEGVLECKRSDGVRKVWKPYTFKVSASTYLLYFKSTDQSKPEGQLLLSNVTQVVLSTSNSASFPFDVFFNGKGSPWKLNTSSNEERISWMEAILPGSCKIVKSAHSSPPMQGYPYNSPASYPSKSLTPSTSQKQNSPVGRQHHTQINIYTPTQQSCFVGNQEDECIEDFLSASFPPPGTPQNYLTPLTRASQNLEGVPRSGGSVKNHMPLKRGLSEGGVGVKPKPFLHPRRASAQSPSPMTLPRTPPRSLPTENSYGAAGTTTDGYVLMMPSPVRRPTKPLSAMPLGNVVEPDYLEVQRDPVLEGAGDLADTVSLRLNHEQIGILMHMLQEVSVDRRQSEEEVGSPQAGPANPNSPIVYSEQDAVTLRGNLNQALRYAPSLNKTTPVTVDDSEESYGNRPKWEKAVHSEPMLPQNGGQENTLSDLQNEALCLAKTDLKDLHEIGQGQFGKVFKAVMRRGCELTPVAIKMTKKTNNDYLQESFLKEMHIMSQMMHPNIVRLYGLVTEDVESPWIVLEYMENGDLKTFLTKNQRPVQLLMKYMIDVAMGMHYISGRGLVHRDLAARNVLVGSSEICKVADFGLLSEIPRDDSIYRSQHNVPCPIRWMSPESISDRHFSPASDVWSFGVLVWEMFNPTKVPYDKYDNLACATKVNEGLRLLIPEGTPSIVAKIMKACWNKIPENRPSFLVICSTLLST